MAALEAAIEDGADLIEIDVQESADGRVVVLHDKDLLRVAGISRGIWTMQSDELALIDVGSWFAREFADQRIPTLEQALIATRGHARLLIELKYNGHDHALAERTLEVLRRTDTRDALIMSLDVQGLRQVRQLDPSLPVGWTVGASIGDLSRIDTEFPGRGREESNPRLHRSRPRSRQAGSRVDRQQASRCAAIPRPWRRRYHHR